MLNNTSCSTRSISQIIRDLTPEKPLYVYRLNNLNKSVKFFLNNFKGETLYAVKSNSDRLIIETLYKLGIKKYDVASLEEIIKVRDLLPSADLYFMHPVKSRQSINQSYYEYGVKSFAVDTFEELKKIVEEVKQPHKIDLYVRYLVPNAHSAHKLGNKFGASYSKAVRLLVECAKLTENIGLCFHVGTQCMDPKSYTTAINLAAEIIKQSGVNVKVLDVGGGFPSTYPGCNPPPLQYYFDAINQAAHDNKLNCDLLCEPGRAIVAESVSIIVKVELRKGQKLYINDGIYGNLSDCNGQLGYLFPVKLIPINKQHSNFKGIETKPFSFFGPTCDSLDFMKGPFFLPSSIQAGDYIEIGQAGAYAKVLSTHFNGFVNSDHAVFTDESAIMSMYD